MESKIKTVNWPSFERLNQIAQEINPEIKLAGLASDQVPDIISKLKEWYPAIQIGMESRHLHFNYYNESCVLLDKGMG